METYPNYNKSLIWKLGVPVLAITLVVGTLIYANGFDDFLKLVGIRASQTQTIELSSEDQLLGASDDEWIITDVPPFFDGVVVATESEIVPADPGSAGIITPIFASTTQDEELEMDHIYQTPAINLGSVGQLIDSISVEHYQSATGELSYEYRSSDDIAALDSEAFAPLELAGVSEELTTATQQLGIPVGQYLQIQVEFSGDTPEAHSAVYGFTVGYGPEAVNNEDLIIPDPEEGNDEDPIIPDPEEETTLYNVPVTLDFTGATTLPKNVRVQVLDTDLVVQPVLEVGPLPIESLIPLFKLNQTFTPGHYTLVLRAAGYEAQVIPFSISKQEPLMINVLDFVAVGMTEPNFDLNSDGVINSLDVTVLLGKLGTTPGE